MTKYYAVKIGRVPGIYSTWSECEAQVKGFSGAIFKSFPTEDLANAFMGNVKSKSINKNLIEVYIDGSYNSDSNEYGYGCYINFGDYQQILCGRGKCIDGGRNVEGEVAGAIIAIKYLSTENRPIVIYHDYEGIGKWANNKWKTNKTYTKNYAELVKDFRNKGMIIFFNHVDAHSNIEGNELVDKLAKYACGIKLTDNQINYMSQYKHIIGYPNFTILPKLDNT